MKKLLILVALLSATTVFGQIKTTVAYRYFFNSEVVFKDQVYNPARPLLPNEETTINSNTNHSLIGASFYIPFNVFDEESPIYSNCFSADVDAFYQFDHNIGTKPIQQYYRFALNFQFVNDVPLYLYTTLNTASTFKYAETTVMDGHQYKVGVNFNVTDQNTDDIINFYASLNYLVSHRYNTLKPHGNVFDASGDFETTIGVIINIKDFLFIEQGVKTITESNYPDLSFSPYYSDYNTTISMKIKKLTLNYTHICFHPIESANDNPKVEGQLNSFGLLLDF